MQTTGKNAHDMTDADLQRARKRVLRTIKAHEAALREARNRNACAEAAPIRSKVSQAWGELSEIMREISTRMRDGKAQLVDAAESLLNSGDDQGGDGLVVVTAEAYVRLREALKRATGRSAGITLANE